MRDPPQPVTSFASRTLIEHILRGVAAAGLIGVAITTGAENPLVSGAALLVALVLMRGCPMCWTVGMIETLVLRRRTRCACDEAAKAQPLSCRRD